ncbi:MAG: enoyl-CoA hydratase/isomerase family protein [Gammaproteobacteria bacterium]|nr:enoyl-CoA hydratase/isomerase family protein [Gammaproteobacteria bacterium]
MKDYSNYQGKMFSCVFEGETAVISLKSESIKMALDTAYMQKMLKCLNAIEVNKEIKGVLALDTSVYEGVEVIKNFINSIQTQSGYVQKEMGVTRYGNSVKRMTLAINEFSKPCVVGIQGKVPIDAFGYFLACDYRIASDDLSIEFPGLKLGVTPTGAVSFFMNRQLGSTKTLQLLMSGKTLSVDEAKDLCLVNEVVPAKQLKAACQAKLDEFYQVPGLTLNLTKQLVRPKTYELEEHFEISSRLMWSSIIDNK